ncbi:MAG TPA: CHASE sensor domain-containing protein [Methylotenera sp.]|nr:CHASE sensor domain-containing protein [Methylotenera sp.]
MNWLDRLPIRTKLTLITVLICTLSLFLASAVMVTYDNHTYRVQKQKEVAAQAEILATRMVASLEFDDPNAAQEYLNPFSLNPEIAAAAVYTAKGKMFASYSRSGARKASKTSESIGHHYEGNELMVFWPVLHDQRQVGSVYLHAITEPLTNRIVRFSGVAFIALLVSLAITLPIAMRIHYAIANPVYARSLIEASLDPMVAINPDGEITDVNAATIKIIGKDRTELIGTDFFKYFTEPDNARQSYEQVFANGFVTDYPLTIWRSDGSLTPVLFNASVYKDERGKVLGVFAAARDVTAQKQAEKEIRQHAVALQTANQELEAFSYSVSHDLRTPLRAIDGFSQAVLEDYSGKLDDQGKNYLQRIRSATQRMGQLIDDMLDLSNIARVEMRHNTVDLSALAQDVITELRNNEPNRVVECHIEPELFAEGDTSLLRVALSNLLGNAWKYSSKTAMPVIKFGMTQDKDGKKEFFVSDNGVGFDMAYADKLFGAFQRLHSISEFPGTGVGLATVQRVIHRHGGSIRGEGILGEGATFYFSLPE